MNDVAEERDEDEAPVRKKGAAELERERRAEEARWKPDQFRCRFCPVTVIERDREGHLARCADAPPGVHVDEAFEKRERTGMPSMARRGRPRKTPRRVEVPRPPCDPDIGARAAELVAAMQTMTRPIGMPALSYFARKQNWSATTLEAALSHCEREHLVETADRRGARIYRLTAKSATHDAGDVDDELPPSDGTGPGARVIELRPTTRPPALPPQPKEQQMPRKTAPEVIDKVKALRAAGKSASEIIETTGRSRSSVYKILKDAGAPSRQRRKANPRAEKLKAAKVSRATILAATTDLADDVRALVRCLDRGWMDHGALVDNLRKLVA